MRPFFIAAVFYVCWFLTLQNARLLLPAAVLLAPAAADCLVPIARRSRFMPLIAAAAVLVSIGVVAAVGGVRAIRFVRDPPRFHSTETQNYADIEWMNTHLDPQRDRVASDHNVLAYLEAPFIFLDLSTKSRSARPNWMTARTFLRRSGARGSRIRTRSHAWVACGSSANHQRKRPPSSKSNNPSKTAPATLTDDR